MSAPAHAPFVASAVRLQDQVLTPLKRQFVGKDEIVDVLGVSLVAAEHLFILGPPGTAKSALVHQLGSLLHGQTFEYLLTRFTEPNEIFGPFDIRKLREGVLEPNIEGMLPEACLAFLDELFNANSAILNSLLTVLNERVLRRGRMRYTLPLITAVGASNHLPDDEALQALFDRFLLRVRSDPADPEDLERVLAAGWTLEKPASAGDAAVTTDDVRALNALVPEVDLLPARPAYLNLVGRIRQAGIALSDRRAVKLQRVLAASALLCGRRQALPSDLWILRHTWNREDQQEVLAALVEESLQRIDSAPGPGPDHPRASQARPPTPELLAGDLAALRAEWERQRDEGAGLAVVRDRLTLLASRSQWVTNEEQRQALQERIDSLWQELQTSEA